MTQLTNLQVSQLNNETPAARKAGLGTIMRKLVAGGYIKLEAIVGKANTNYAQIDACDAKNMATISDPTIFTNSLTTAMFREGTGANLIQSLTTAAALTSTVMRTIVSADWHSSDTFGMWVFSDTQLSAGDIQFVINATTGGLQYINLPAITPGVWTWIEIAKGAVTCSDVIGYGFRRHAAKVFNLYVDNIVRFLAANTSVLGNVPLATDYDNASVITTSPQIVMAALAAASVNTPAVLTEGTDYIVGVDAKRIIFKTDQSANTGFVLYAA
jgi:hypothetical protein